MIETLIAILIVCLIGYVIFYVIGQVGLPEPFRTVIYVVLAIILILILLSYLGIVADPLRAG